MGMALISTDSGCRVGWETYDDKTEAEARAVTARASAREMAGRGYDFGFQVPGEIVQRRDLDQQPVDEWVVTVP